MNHPRPLGRSLESKDNELGCSTVYQDIHTVSGSISYKKEQQDVKKPLRLRRGILAFTF